MKKLCVFLVVIITATGLCAQTLVRAEYFVDTDPGPGNGAALSLDAVNSIQEFISPGLFSEGVHLLGIRTQSGSGIWSITNFRSFIVDESENGVQIPVEVIAAEYFIDSDPGPGNGIELAMDAGFSIEEVISADLISSGVHRMGLRTKASNGLWSLTNFRTFIVQENDQGVGEAYEIVAAEYFTDIDPGPGLGIPIPISASDSISLDETINQLGEQLGLHYLSLRFKSSNGLWCAPEVRQIQICEEYGPLAGFSFIRSGNHINFTDESSYATSLLWTYHDGTTSESAFPSKEYIPGVYPVTLTATNSCGENSKSDTIRFNGIGSVYPNTGSNLGNITVFIYGAGFVEGTTVWIDQAGSNQQIPVNLFVEPDGLSMRAIFNLTGVNIGTFDFWVSIPGDSDYYLPQSFFVTDVIGGTLSHSFIGPSSVRPNWWRNYDLVVTNNAFIDVTKIQFVLAFPIYADVNPQFEILITDDFGEIVSDTVEFTPIDSLNGLYYGMQVYFGILPYIPSQSSIKLTTSVRMNELGEFQAFGRIFNAIASPVEVSGLGTVDSQNLINGSRELNQCSDIIFAGKMAAIMLTALGDLIGATGCITGAAETLSTGWDLYVNGVADGALGAFQTLDLVKTASQTILDCAMAVGALTPPAVVIKVSTALMVAVEVTADIALLVAEYEDACSKPKINPNNKKRVNVLTSVDPNEILGPGEYNEYINEMQFPYTVFFENADTAQVSAVEVVITDILDTNLFDLNTFQLREISFGNNIISIPPGLQSYSTNYSIGNGLLARINVNLDHSTGEILWRFITLDSLTLDYPDDVFAGFLPPNVNSPEGEGYVSFVVNRRNDLEHATMVENTASIIFDTNEPIFTNTWTNILDLNPPVSLMNPVEPQFADTLVTLNWSASDDLSGVGLYTIYMSENGAPFVPIRSGIQNTTIDFIGEWGSTYEFFVEAADNVGNQEIKEPIAEASFTPWPEQIVAIAAITGVQCPGDANGSINLNLVGGDGAYTVSWSNGTQGTQLSNLSAGDYTVTVVDGIGNEFQSTYSVESPAVIVANASISAPPCFGQTGSVSLDISGGTPPYDVVWGGQDPSALPVGEYNYSVVDQNHCMFESSVVITSPTALMVESSIVADSNAICAGSITLMVIGGVAPYSFEWSHDATLNSSSAQNLCEGNYSVIVTDANGCEVLNENLITGIGNELLKPSHWVLSPNPTQGQLLLTCGGVEHIDYIDLYNAEGRLIKHACSVQNTIDAGTFMLDLSNYPNGIYTIQINTPTRRETQKVVLSKD